MPPFDYNAPAELFLAKRTKSSREKYRRFATAAEAIRNGRRARDLMGPLPGKRFRIATPPPDFKNRQ